MQAKAHVCPCFPPESFWFLVQPDAHHSIVPPYTSTPNSPTWKKSGKLNEFLARKKGLLKFESKLEQRHEKRFKVLLTMWGRIRPGNCDNDTGMESADSFLSSWGTLNYKCSKCECSDDPCILPMPQFPLDGPLACQGSKLSTKYLLVSLCSSIHLPGEAPLPPAACWFFFLDSIISRARRSGASWCISWLAPHKRTPPYTHTVFDMEIFVIIYWQH